MTKKLWTWSALSHVRARGHKIDLHDSRLSEHETNLPFSILYKLTNHTHPNI